MKQIYFSLTVFMISVVPLFSIAQEWINIQSFQPAQTLHSIRFANDTVGYTVSSLYNGSTYNIHKTTDAGETWIDQSSGYTATRFKDICVISEDTVWMCGNYGLVIHTFDGGENWIADTVSPAADHFFGISFVGATGYVCGNSGAIFKTTDMGENWVQLPSPVISAFEEIYFLDENYGFIAGLNYIFITSDGGETWNEPETFPGATTNWWLREFSFIYDSIGFVCADIGQVYKTTDKGKNWEFLPNTGTAESLQSIVALDENNLYACGFAGTVIRSIDGGISWNPMTTATSQNLYSLDFTPGGYGFACSHIGEILKYTDPYTSIEDEEHTNELSVFPNPTNGNVRVAGHDNKQISDQFSEASFYSISGELVKSFPAANNFDISDFNPGTYIIVLKGKNGAVHRQQIIRQ